MASVVRATAFSIMAAMLGACGTGGGGGGGSGTPTQIPPAPGQTPAPEQTTQRQTTPPDSTPRTDVAFTTFAAVQPNQNVIMGGSAITMSGTQTSNGPVTSVGPEANGASNLTLGFNSQRNLTALAIRASASSRDPC